MTKDINHHNYLCPVSAGAVIYQGDLLYIEDGFARRANTEEEVDSQRPIKAAICSVDNTHGNNGDKEIEYATEDSVFEIREAEE